MDIQPWMKGVAVVISAIVAWAVAFLLVSIVGDMCTKSGRRKLAGQFSWWEGVLVAATVFLVLYGVRAFEIWATGNAAAFAVVFLFSFFGFGVGALRDHGTTARSIVAVFCAGLFGLFIPALYSWLEFSQPSAWAVGSAIMLAVCLLAVRWYRKWYRAERRRISELSRSETVSEDSAGTLARLEREKWFD